MRKYVYIDDRGWVQHSSDAHWDPVHDTEWARRGLPWSPAEDRALLSRYRVLVDRPELSSDDVFRALVQEHKRNGGAIGGRLQVLKAGLRLAALAKLSESA